MQRSTIRRTAAANLTLGTALTVLGTFPDRVSSYFPLPVLWYDVILILGLALILVAGALFLASKLPPIASVSYGIAGIEPDALNSVYDFILTVLDDVAPYEIFRSWYEKNPEVIHAVVKITAGKFSSRQELVGFFSIFPVTTEARHLLERNELLGAAFTARHICGRGTVPAAYYIGAVGGIGRRGRHATLFHLTGYVAALLRRHSKLIFTRPMTEDGLRLAQAYKFAPVRSDVADVKNTIYVRDFARNPVVV